MTKSHQLYIKNWFCNRISTMNIKSENLKGSSSLFFAGILFATYGVFTRIVSEHFSVTYQIWTRALIAAAILLIIGMTMKSFKKIAKKDLKWFAIYSLGAALTNIPFIMAVNNAPLGTVLFLFYSVCTVLSFIYGRVFFGEKIDATKFISIVLALVGMVFLYHGSMGLTNPIYLLLAMLSGFFYSLDSVFNKKISNNYTVLQIAFSNQLIVSLFTFLVFLIVSDKVNTDFISLSWLANVIFSVVLAVTSMLVVYGFKRIEVQKGSLILLSELVFVVLFGFVFYDEVPTITALFGSLLILVALVAPNIKLRPSN